MSLTEFRAKITAMVQIVHAVAQVIKNLKQCICQMEVKPSQQKGLG